MRWAAAAPTSSLGQIQVSLVKGGETQYNIEEDDRYYISIANLNPPTIIMVMNINVSSKMYDVTKAKSMCSTITGLCHLNFGFPRTQFVIVSTPNNGDLDGWYVEISFVVRIVTCIAILGGCENNGQGHEEEARVREVTETSPLLPEKIFRLPYGTGEEDLESNRSSSWEDGKICVICYDKPRNCFLVPCGHRATFYDCAQRISDGESKVCPLCRRLIHKLRKLIIPSKGRSS